METIIQRIEEGVGMYENPALRILSLLRKEGFQDIDIYDAVCVMQARPEDFTEEVNTAVNEIRDELN